jgi:hypothetical protein
MRDEHLHDLRIDCWNNRIVVTGKNQRWLLLQHEPRETGPTSASHHLIEVAERLIRLHGVSHLAHELWI